MNRTFTRNSFVNTERGCRLRTSELITLNNNNMSTLLQEMQQFRTEIIARLEDQIKAFEQLQDRV